MHKFYRTFSISCFAFLFIASTTLLRAQRTDTSKQIEKFSIQYFKYVDNPANVKTENKVKNLEKLPHSKLKILKNYNVADGLTQCSVYSIFRDSKGFVWIGTANGINRFDSYEFSEIQLPAHQFGKRISANIFEDSEQNIWAGGENTVYKYNPKTQTTGLIKLPVNNLYRHYVTSIGEDVNHRVWILAPVANLFAYDLRKGQISAAINFEKLVDDGEGVSCAVITKKQTIVIGTTHALFKYDVIKHKLIKFIFPGRFNTVNSIIPASESSYYLLGSGLWYVDLESGTATEYLSAIDFKVGTFSDGLLFNKKLYIWNTTKGLLEYDLNINSVTGWDSTFNNISYAICHQQLKNSENSDSSNFLIGTTGEGAILLDLSKPKFNKFQKRDGMPFSSEFVRAIFKDRYGRIWHGTIDKGLNVFNPRTGKVDYFNIENGKLQSNTVTAIYRDSRQNIWLGTANGMVLTNDDLTRFKYYALVDSVKGISKVNRGITSIVEVNNNLIASGSSGIYIQRNANAFYIYDNLSDYTLTSFYDKKNNFLIVGKYGSDALVLKVNSAGNSIALQKLKILPDIKSLRCVKRDKLTGYFLFATDKGLIVYDDSDDRIVTTINEAKGLANEFIYSILQDSLFRIWVSSNKGLSMIEPGYSRIINYGLDDGLQSNEFNLGAYYEATDGEFFFGGISGYNSFFPLKLFPDTIQRNIVITSLKINDSPVAVDSLMAKNKRAEFSYQQNNIFIKFSAMEFVEPMKIKYAYSLKGVDGPWYFTNGINMATFNNLAYGDYELSLKCTSTDGIWLKPQTQFKFSILPPIYQRWWFLVCLAILISATVGVVIRYILIQKLRLKQEETKRRVELLEIREKISRDMHDEIGSGLSRITLLSQTAAKDKDADAAKQKLEKMKIISQQLGGQINEMVWSVNPAYDKLDSLLSYIHSYFADILEENNIDFEICFPEKIPATEVFSDWRRNIFLITREALNNALKYSETKKMQIRFEFLPNGWFNYIIRDFGKGFDTSIEKEFSNGLKNMQKRAHEIGCKCTINAFEHFGTEVKISGKIKYYLSSSSI